MELIQNWTDENRANYGKKVMSVQHAMNDTGLFTDEALAAMLDAHPTHLIDVLAVPHGHKYQQYQDQQLTVDFRGASGKTLVEAAKAGDIGFTRALALSQSEYATGVTNSDSSSESICPPRITFAMLARAPAPGPLPVAIGTIAATSITVVIMIGRKRAAFAWRIASFSGSPFARSTFV